MEDYNRDKQMQACKDQVLAQFDTLYADAKSQQSAAAISFRQAMGPLFDTLSTCQSEQDIIAAFKEHSQRIMLGVFHEDYAPHSGQQLQNFTQNFKQTMASAMHDTGLDSQPLARAIGKVQQWQSIAEEGIELRRTFIMNRTNGQAQSIAHIHEHEHNGHVPPGTAESILSNIQDKLQLHDALFTPITLALIGQQIKICQTNELTQLDAHYSPDTLREKMQTNSITKEMGMALHKGELSAIAAVSEKLKSSPELLTDTDAQRNEYMHQSQIYMAVSAPRPSRLS